MAQVWFTADTHFGHANIIRHSDRPFADVAEQDRVLTENWNAHVGPTDLVYHLGDFAYKSGRPIAEVRRRLHGQVYLFLGNHDALNEADRKLFLHVGDVAEVKVAGGRRVWLSHYAHRVWPGSHRGTWHLYGHSHGSLPDDSEALSLDVGVDAVARRLSGPDPPQPLPQDYRPANVDELAAVMATKRFVPVDHHGRESASDRSGG